VRIALPFAAERAIPAIAERVGFAASVTNIDLGLLAGHVTVEGLRVSPLGAAPDARDLLSLGRAFANLEWLRLVRGELALAELTLDAPVLALVRAPDGYIELPVLPPSSEPEPPPDAEPDDPLPVALDSLAIHGTQLHLIDGAGGPDLIDFSLAALDFSDLRVEGAKVGLGGIRISEPRLRVRRELRTTRTGARNAAPAPVPSPDASAPGAPPDVRIDDLTIERAEFEVVTDGEPVLVALRLKTSGLTLAPDAPFPLDFGIEVGGGSLTLAGRLGLNPLVWDGQLRWQGLAAPLFVRAATPELIPWLRSCSASGDLAVKLAPTGLHASGRIGVDELALEDPDQEIALAWKSLAIELRSADVPLSGTGEPVVLAIAKISLDSPHARYVLPNTALERLATASGGSRDAGGEPVPAEPAPEPTTAQPGAAPRIAIDTIEVRRGDVEFVDHSGPDRYAGNLKDLTIDAAGVSLPERSVKSLRVRGIAPERAPFDLRAALPDANGTLAFTLTKLPLAQFTPYTARAADVRIPKGDLSLEAKAKLAQRGAAGTVDAKVVVHQLAISGGPNAIQVGGMPIDLALALLRDPGGDIALPIPLSYGERGTSTGVGAILLGALRAAITGAVTSPLKALGAVVPEGNVAETSFAPLPFAPGSSTASPDVAETLAPLVSLLAQRPALGLTLRGRAGAEDRLALAEQILVERVAAGDGLPDLDDAGFLARRRVQSALAERRRGEPSSLEPEDEALLARYLEATAVPPERYVDLARRRAESVRDLLAASIPAERLGVETASDAGSDVVPELRVSAAQ
jgi:hypothetical protein